MIRWYVYSHKSEQLKLWIGNEFCFLFEMLLISLMFFLWLSTLNKVTNLVFVMGRFLMLILLIFVRYQFLFCFCIIFQKKTYYKRHERHEVWCWKQATCRLFILLQTWFLDCLSTSVTLCRINFYWLSQLIETVSLSRGIVFVFLSWLSAKISIFHKDHNWRFQTLRRTN